MQFDKNAATKVAIVQAAYGAGALVSPLSATAFSTMKHWSFHYLVSLGGSVANIIFLVLVFRFQNLDGQYTQHIITFTGLVHADSLSPSALLKKAGQTVREHNLAPQEGLYRQMFRLKSAHLLALFALAYVGAEVTLGGLCRLYFLLYAHSFRNYNRCIEQAGS